MGSDLYHTAERSVRLEAVVASLGVIAFAFGVGIMLASLGLAALTAVGYTVESAPVVTLGLQYVLLASGFLLVVVGYVTSQDRADLLSYRLPTRTDVLWIVGGFLALVVVSAALDQVITALGLETAQNQVIAQGRDRPVLFLVMLPITLLVVAPGEELVFRGVVQGQFRRAYGAVPAVVIASILFGVSHTAALSGPGKLTYLAVATILGLILGAVYERTENIVVPILIHAAWNSTLYLGEWLRIVHGVALLG